MEQMYDVAVVGLGPAGATLARLLSPRLKVLALDKKGAHSREQGFRKPCGGLLAPDAQKALARLGLTLPLEVLVDPQIFSVRTLDVPSGTLRHYQRFYLNLDRHAFDLWLKSLIPEQVEVRHGARCTSLVKEGESYRLTWEEAGASHTARAKYVVGADGAHSLVRKTVFPKARIKAYLAIQQWFEDSRSGPFYSCVFDPKATDCYAWGLSKNGRFLFGGAFPPKRAKAAFAGLKERLKAFGFPLDAPLKTQACLVLRPNGLTDCRSGKGGAFLIGEAAGFVSPSSLEGISHGLVSACKLARALNSGRNANLRYRLSTLSIRLRLFAKTLKCPFMYWPPLRWLVMKSGAASIQVEPDLDLPA